MAAQLAAVPGLDWAFFDALTALSGDLHYDSRVARATLRRELTPGELGCFASHAALWRRIAALPPGEAMVVFEDDLLIDPDFLAGLEGFAAAVAGHDYVRLHAKAPAPATVIGRAGGRHLVRYRGLAFGTQAYLMRPPAAQRLLASISRVVRPVDDEMDRYWAHGVPNIGVFPFPVVERALPSSIEAARRGLPPAGWRDIGYQRRRIVNGLGRRLANVRLDLGLPL
jgi:glycosyl transferase family 25